MRFSSKSFQHLSNMVLFLFLISYSSPQFACLFLSLSSSVRERRELELHETYLKARTPEEAAAVLQRYAQRFSISETVLEHLKLPRVLERSISADPTRPSSSSNDLVFSASSSSSFNPLQYLRQQSLPAQKFTTTVEARVAGYGAEHVAVGREGGGAGATRSRRSIPLLSAKPYSHNRAAKVRLKKFANNCCMTGKKRYK